MKYEVFISYKKSAPNGDATKDAHEARKVYDELRAAGLKGFFSEESLAETGRGHFAKSIENALDQAGILVLVSSCREHIESRWVEAEWDSFMNDIRSGNKKGELFIMNCGELRRTDLPLFLRRQQMFQANEMGQLVKFVKSALPRKIVLKDLIFCSLHCYREALGEDKVYLVTIREEEAGYQVKAHWGPRAARRLNSQMKGVGLVSKDKAEQIAKSLRSEKERSGYKTRSVGRLLTREALRFLEADLGLSGLQNNLPAKDSAVRTEQCNDLAYSAARIDKLRAALASALCEWKKMDSKKATEWLQKLTSKNPEFAFLQDRVSKKKRKPILNC